MDRVIERSEFALGIRRVKVACVDDGVDRAKKEMLALSSGSGFGPSEPGAMARSTDEMHAAIWAFMRWTSYLISDWVSLVLLISAICVPRRRMLFQATTLRAVCERNLVFLYT